MSTLLVLSFAVSGLASAQGYKKAAGSNHILLLKKDDGTVWGFGDCTSGQVGLAIDNC